MQMAAGTCAGGSKSYEAFEVPLDNTTEDESLQGAFAKYRKRRKEELKLNADMALVQQLQRKNPERMNALRTKFLEQATTYIGTPYARKYHEPDSPTFSAKLFLDCCGLIRRVLKDLKEEFGFFIGPWNQAYMFDTLPLAYSEASEMEPGDLIFISGVYNNANAKQHPHNIVHVEIWMGEGEKVLGARWHKGRVEVHESYKFEAKSYHSMEYHFRSINSWLAGECKSFCSEHTWQIQKFDPSKHSIFSLEEELSEDGEEAAYSQLEVKEDENVKMPLLSPPLSPQQSSGDHKNKKTQRMNLGRSFIICEGNAGPLVEKHLTANGWWKTDHKAMYTLKWTEFKQSIDYKSFREGEQLVNHFPNINILTTKIGLLESLRTYYRIQRHRVPLESFFPQTFRMDLASEREKFFSTYGKDGEELWICKPTSANQGKGIFLVRDVQQVVAHLEQDQMSCRPGSKPVARIVQRYLSKPLLLHGRKFDLRVYMLVVWGRQWVVFYREGHVKLCCERYEASSNNLLVHLTNQFQQKKSPLFPEVKEDTVWDFKKLQEHVCVEYGLPADWVQTTLTERMKTIMTICFKSVKHKLSQAVGFFELLGFDFMLDSNFNVWLIEININPAQHMNREILTRISPSVVAETLDIAIEIFDKCRKNRTVDPVTSIQHFMRLNLK